MADDDFDPAAYLRETEPKPFDPAAYLRDTEGFLARAHRAGSEAFSSAVQGAGLTPGAIAERGPLSSPSQLGKEVLNAAYAPIAYPMAAGASLLSEPVAGAVRGIGEGVNWLGQKLSPKWEAQHPSQAQVSESVRPGVETALGAVGTRLTPASAASVSHLPNAPRVAPAPAPTAPAPGPLGVTLSEGQATGELPLIQTEQRALSNLENPRAHARAQEFADQQAAQREAAQESVARGLDPHGGVLAENPQEAGQIVSGGLRGEAANRRAIVDQAYEYARAQPGEVHASVFEDMGQSIRGDLTHRSEPIIIDDRLTPYASQAIRDIDERVANLDIQNRAGFQRPIDPFTGQPMPINGVNLSGVDQMRKRLVEFRRGAYASGNDTDGRAASAIVRAFDDRIDRAVNSGMFSGGPDAVDAWNQARAAHSAYQRDFRSSRGDAVGKNIEKILGQRGNQMPATPNDVVNMLYGASGTNPNTTNVATAMRVRNILGAQSPEWGAVKQGLFSRLVERGQGQNEIGVGEVANRVNKFLHADGMELANVLFSPQERQLIQSYADLMRQLQVPRRGLVAGSAPYVVPILQRIGNASGMKIAAVIGGFIGHSAGMPFVGEAAGAIIGAGVARVSRAVSQRRELAQISRQMPLVAEQMQQWQQAVARAQRLNSPPSSAAAAVAGSNLARTLSRMGIKVPQIESISRSQGQENNDGTPRPRGNVQNNDNKGNPNGYAHGGRVTRFWHPVQVGARRASDGHWYVADPDRPSKYLRVQNRNARAPNAP